MVTLNRSQKRNLGAVLLVVAFISLSAFILTSLNRQPIRGSLPVIGGSLVVRLPAAGLDVRSAQSDSEIAFRFTKSNLAHIGLYSDAIVWTRSEWSVDAAVVSVSESDHGGQPLAKAELARVLAQRQPALRAAMADRESAAKNYDRTGRWGSYFRQYSMMVDAGSDGMKGSEINWNNVVVTIARIVRSKSFGVLGCAIAAIGAALFFKNAPPRANRVRFECEACGYDLRGTPPGKPCPECGNVPEEVASPAASP